MGSDLYVRGQSLVMSKEPILNDETTHGQWNTTAIPYKCNYTVFSCGRWARQKNPMRGKLDVKLNLTDRTILLSHLLCTDFSFRLPKLTIVACGQFLAVEDKDRRYMQGERREGLSVRLYPVIHFSSEGI